MQLRSLLMSGSAPVMSTNGRPTPRAFSACSSSTKAAARAFRMDDRKQRLIVNADAGEGVSFYGWEVADVDALDALAAHLEKSGIAVARGSRALAEERRVQDLIVFGDPVGNRLEAFHGAELAIEPFKPGRSISGFRTGPLGMGHAVLTTARLDQLIPFYTSWASA